MNDLDIVTRLRMYAEDLHSAGGFNGYASAMSLAANEIVKLREYAGTIEAVLDAIAAEREACARLCDAKVKDEYATGQVDHNEIGWTESCAFAIRARGEK